MLISRHLAGLTLPLALRHLDALVPAGLRVAIAAQRQILLLFAGLGLVPERNFFLKLVYHVYSFGLGSRIGVVVADGGRAILILLLESDAVDH